jgi:hypothetical protein
VVAIRRARAHQLEARRTIDGEDARVVGVARLGELIDRPAHAGADGEVRRAIAAHRGAEDVLEQVARALDVGAELPPQLVGQVVVEVAVAGDLVPGGGDAPHERRVALGDLAEDEERRPRPGGGEVLQQRVGVALDAVGRRIGDQPTIVEPVLDVDRHGVPRRDHAPDASRERGRVPRPPPCPRRVRQAH